MVKIVTVNIEHLLDIFTTIDLDLDGTWNVCGYFMEHLTYLKPRLVLPGPKIEALPDAHPSKPRCLVELSKLFNWVGNRTEYKRLLTHALKLWRERGEDFEVAKTLRCLSDANRLFNLYEEGIQQAREGLEIYKRLDNTFGQARSSLGLCWLLYGDRQLNTAEEIASQSIGLVPETVDQYLVCGWHHLLGVRTGLANRPTEPMLVSLRTRYTKVYGNRGFLQSGSRQTTPVRVGVTCGSGISVVRVGRK